MGTISKARNLLAKEQLAALGEIAAESAQLEATVDLMIQIALKINIAEFDALVSGRMLGAKVDVLKTCGLSRLPGKRKKSRRHQFTVLMDHIKHLLSKRAVAIHGIWEPEGGMNLGNLMAGWAGDLQPGKAEAKHKKGNEGRSA